MPSYRLTRKADGDLTTIYLYSFQHFGEAQADTYALSLQICFEVLTEQPRIGQIRPGKGEDSRLFFHRSHVIAYRIVQSDILIQRILDTRRDWQRIIRFE
jgi:toxin ParE1/3/4